MKRRRIWRLIFMYAIIILLLAIFMPRELDWNPSFSKDHSTPYGGEAIYGTLDDLFTAKMDVIEKPLYNAMKDTTFERTNYVIINSDFYVDSLDLSALYRFVASGNNALIAAENFNREFLDSLGLKISGYFNDFVSLEELNSISTELIVNPADTTYTFKSQWSNSYFKTADSNEIVVRGIGRQDTMNNYVKVPYGSGFFYLHSFPFALTNYYLMKNENQNYIASVFSQLPADYDVLWDEYYKPQRNNVQRSPLSVLMRYPSFRWVYWLSISGLLLFMIFYAKRKQRPIPIIEPPKNESLKFAKTLGGLYYNKGSHKDIFEKKMKVFKEFIHTHYFMSDIEYTKEEALILTLKSGRDQRLVERIFELADEYSGMQIINDAQLKAIISKVNEFYSFENSWRPG